ncbi:hypothetical protein SEA_FORK_110 [Microbacterium phage Fork]|nr:hypothetical protein SEA_FORK_110 [Microbacterium phage Fork]
MINEPKDAVRAALAHAATGNTSGSWLSDNPRPGLEHLYELYQSAAGAELYDIMLDAVRRGQKDAKSAAHGARARILYDLELLADRIDSHALHVYAASLRAELYPEEGK